METQEHDAIVEALNGMLAKEHSCAIRYATHAAVLTGPFGETLSRQLKEIASDEIEHAEKLRDRVFALGGAPTMNVHPYATGPFATLAEMLDANIREERGAIEEYTRILQMIPRMNVILYETVEDILRDEQEHLEKLLTVKPSE
ncbi:MAG TPA: ferritin-like domain-containing protein [Planctomycetota bacterium]|nr:ferritin-like domain-containing protein [Planctomycetota bacterium]